MQSTRAKYLTEYRALRNAIHRCHNSKNKQYKDYGGRGITVFDEWHTDFDAFIKHIGPKPSPDLTLERIDNDKGYEPNNVTWATRSEQQYNRRSHSSAARITINGQSYTLNEWSKISGINATTLRSRLNKGVSQSELLNPVGKTGV
jgi:hypothetical protein